MTFTTQLISQFEAHSNPSHAKAMEAYMKYLFVFLGIKAPLRKELLKNVVNTNKLELKSNITEISKALYKKKEREFHYCAFDLYARFKKQHYIKSDVKFIEYLITTHSHWDSVDFIAKNILGQFLIEFPNLINETITRFSADKNMWLNRSAILFQLGYKDKTNDELLFQICDQYKTSNEFFIKKAIGWALREYSKTDMKRVVEFVASTNLKPLSNREALKHSL